MFPNHGYTYDNRQVNTNFMHPFEEIRVLREQLTQAISELNAVRFEAQTSRNEVQRLSIYVAKLNMDINTARLREAHLHSAASEQFEKIRALTVERARLSEALREASRVRHQRSSSQLTNDEANIPDLSWRVLSSFDEQAAEQIQHANFSSAFLPMWSEGSSAEQSNAASAHANNIEFHHAGVNASTHDLPRITPTLMSDFSHLPLRSAVPARPHRALVGPYVPGPSTSGMASGTIEVGSHSQLMVMTQNSVDHFDFPRSCERLFRYILKWAHCYCSQPKSVDMSMPSDIRAAVGRITFTFLVNKLISNEQIRPKLFERYIIENVTENVWTSAIVEDFDGAPDQLDILASVRESLKGALAEQTKAALYVMQQEAMLTLKSMPEFEAYIALKASETGRALFKKLQPFIEDPHGTALVEFRGIWGMAFNMGVDMMCTTYSFRFNYIKPSNNSYFSPDSMESVDPQQKGVSGAELRKNDMKVTACISPVVIMTQVLSNSIAPKTVKKATVVFQQ